MKIVIFIRTNNEDAYTTVMHDAAKANPKVITVSIFEQDKFKIC